MILKVIKRKKKIVHHWKWIKIAPLIAVNRKFPNTRLLQETSQIILIIFENSPSRTKLFVSHQL